jgi:hypothetical protein
MHKPIGRLSIRKAIPKDRQTRGYHSIPREPHDEPLTPGLRKKELSECIGFVTDFTESEYEDEWE